ncbi:MAG TPA: ATP-binding cassette domain-containing protein [Thermoanaerobaculia bacterium]|nr:ATP-binding cassette domain-containing protein [Thermoanaerobaculia bacterium]
MIRLERATRTFIRASGAPVHALRGLDLQIRKGETMALLGPSGCGKTTTLRLINRLIEPSSGRVLLDGEDTAELDPIRLRRRMGYVVQSGGLFPHLTVARNIGLLCEIERWRRPDIDQRVDELLDLVHLPPSEFRDRHPGELSGGERQRVGVARALALDPEILLMDEPFGALDPITRTELQHEFSELERLVAKTVVLVSHDLDEAFLLGDRVALLCEGELVQLGTPDELRSAPATPWVERFLAGRVQ